MLEESKLLEVVVEIYFEEDREVKPTWTKVVVKKIQPKNLEETINHIEAKGIIEGMENPRDRGVWISLIIC